VEKGASEQAWVYLLPGSKSSQRGFEANHRIDLILFRSVPGFKDVVLAGDRQADRTPSGLWPSDHAGLAGTSKRHGEEEDDSVISEND